MLWLGPIESTPLKRWQLCLDVNLTGVFLVTKAVIPHVRARGGGSLIAVTTTGVTMTTRRERLLGVEGRAPSGCTSGWPPT